MNLYIPRHPSKITLKQFVAFHAAKSDAEKVRVITGISEKQVGKLKMETVDLVISTFDKASMGSGEFTPLVKVRPGLFPKRLGFIPDLQAMTLAEYTEIDNYRTSIWAKNKTFYKHLPLLMAVLYRPLKTCWPFGKYYKIQPYNADEVRYYLDWIEALPMSAVNGALLFFSTLQNRLLENSQDYLVTEAKKTVQDL